MKTLDWDNLKTLDCPADFGSLSLKSGLLRCDTCEFSITPEKCREIVARMFNETGDHFSRAQFEELFEAEIGIH